MEAKDHLKILILIFITATFAEGLYSQQVPEHSYLWLNAGLGPGSFSTMSGNFGPSFGFGLNYSSHDRIYKVRFVRVDEFDFNILGDPPPRDSVWETGILYGLSSVKKKSMLSLSAGLSVVHSKKNYYAEYDSPYAYRVDTSKGFGIPIEAQAVWFIFDGMGASVNIFANINKENSFGGVIFGVIIGGEMRSKEQEKHK